MRKRLFYMLSVGILLITGCTTTVTTWGRSVNKPEGQRFIPIELWNGSPWQEDYSLEAKPVGFVFGIRNHKQIKGPFSWTHPRTGEVLQVYERTSETSKGIKRQFFTINPDKTGLSKVFDERPGMPTRYFSTNAVLFPLGVWKAGEKRVYTFDEYVQGERHRRTASIHMRRLSLTYKDVRYAMKYDLIITDDTGKMLFHERFVYGPGKGLMYYKDRM